MSLILVASILIRLIAMGWSVVLLRRMRDGRMAFLTLMLGLMALRQTLTLVATRESWSLSVTSQTTELPGLLVSVMAILVVVFLERLIAERKQVEETLRASEEKFSRAFRASPSALIISSLDEGRFIDVNDTFLQATGYTRDEVIGQTAVALSFWPHPDDRVRFLEHVKQQDSVRNYEAVFKQKSGATGIMSISSEIIDLDGERCLLSVAHVITEQKRAEQALRESEAKFRTIVDHAPIGIFLTDEYGDDLYTNTVHQRQLGLTFEESLGKGWQKAIHPEDRERTFAQFYGAAKKQSLYDDVLRYLHRDGRVVWVRCVAAPVVEGGALLGYVGMIEDITERKQAARKLEESEKLLRAIAENIPRSYLSVIHRDMTVGFTSGRAFRRRDLDPKAFVGLHIRDVFGRYGEAVLETVTTAYRRAFAGQEQFFELFIEGEHQVYETVPMVDEQGEIYQVLAVVQDITARKQAEDALRESEERYRTLYEEVETARQRLEDLSRRLVEVQEQERRHIAIELHDEIGQLLTALKLLLETADLAEPEAAHEKLEEAQALTDVLVAKIRDLSLDLRPAMLDDFGLLPTLQWHAERYTAQTGVAVDFQPNGLSEQRLPSAIETAAYRIVQEALTNVARHADVDRVVVRVEAQDDAVRLQIEDEGSGFDVASALRSPETGGLSGLHERAGLMGGDVTISSNPGRGTCIRAVLPLRTGKAPREPRLP